MIMASKEEMTEVPTEDANNYCKILSVLGMEEEGDPVAEVARLVALVTETFQ